MSDFVIKQVKKNYVLYDGNGHRLGTYPSLSAARQALNYIKLNKSQSEKQNLLSHEPGAHPRDPAGRWAQNPNIAKHRTHGH